MPNLTSPPAVRIAETVEVSGVRKAFGDLPVLRGVDLHIPAGTIVSLLGPSGCGKTTLLRTVAGLERPDAGTIRIGARVVHDADTSVPAERRRVGMVFQDWALFPHMTVAENIAFGLSRAERRSGRVQDALALVELLGRDDWLPSLLSGGQQQRVALARALATEPSVLLLDEPFSNLDAGLRTRVRADVHALLSGLGVTTLFVTHDQEEAFAFGDQVAVMLDGHIQQQDTPAEVYLAPANREVAAFVGETNLLPGIARGGMAETLVGAVPLRAPGDGPVEVVVRPEQLAVEAAASPAAANGGCWRVAGVEYYGHDAVYALRATTGEPLRVRVIAAPVFVPGDDVAVRYNGAPAVAFPADH